MKNERKDELLSIINKSGSQNDIKAKRLVEEVIFLEEQMEQLKAMPFIEINPKNPVQQRPTKASAMYIKLLQQYNNSLRLLFRLSGDIGESDEESPLRKWVKSRKELQ